MNKRVKVAKRAEVQDTTFGGSASVTQYELLGTFWAAEDFNRGVKSLREGAYDAYDTVMFRMRYNAQIDRWCLIQYQGKWYQIQSFNASYQDNTIQITATEMANQQVTIVHPVVVEIWGNQACTQRPSGMKTTVYAQFKQTVSESVTLTNDDFTLRILFAPEQNAKGILFWVFGVEQEGTAAYEKGSVVRLSFSMPGAQPPTMVGTANYTFTASE